ncbi:MAG TPA: hypothetical protein VGR13_08135 [Actinomycetota bacterium]|nr:hypothetical protein [Actinomycetota bacterium]
MKPLTVAGGTVGSQIMVLSAALVMLACALGILAGGIWLVGMATRTLCLP